MPKIILENLDQCFTHQAPDEYQQVRYETIREDMKRTAKTLLELCPQGRERSLALTYLQQACMWANAAIALENIPDNSV